MVFHIPYLAWGSFSQMVEFAPVQHPAAPLDEMANVPPMTGLQGLLNSSDATDTDPRWTELSQQPATQGVRSPLNQIGLSLPPAMAELEQRRQQYHQEQAEA
ncbi:hypothetical protein [Dermabacter hominis]